MTITIKGVLSNDEGIIIEGYNDIESFNNDTNKWNVLAELADKHYSTEETDGRFTDEGIQFISNGILLRECS